MAALLIVLGIASAAYGASIMLVNSGTSFFAVWHVIAALCLVPGIAQVLLPASPLVSGLCLTAFILLAVAALVFLYMSVRIMRATSTTPPAGLDYLLVLGAQVRPDGSPSVVLRNRLEAALTYLAENPRSRPHRTRGPLDHHSGEHPLRTALLRCCARPRGHCHQQLPRVPRHAHRGNCGRFPCPGCIRSLHRVVSPQQLAARVLRHHQEHLARHDVTAP